MSVLHDIKNRLFGAEEQPIAVRAVLPHRVVMYATRFCPFCMRARALLTARHIPFKEIAVDGKPELRTEMTQKSGRYTVPQIWIDDVHIGGCEELMQLERTGELDRLLSEDLGESDE